MHINARNSWLVHGHWQLFSLVNEKSVINMSISYGINVWDILVTDGMG